MNGLCSQHSSTCDKIFKHESQIATITERIDQLEERCDKIEEVQARMLSELQDVAAGFRGLASRIDDAIKIANGSGNGEGNPSPAKEVGPQTFTQSLNMAWRKFQDNLALFFIYAIACGFVWMFWKTVTGDWKIDSNILRLFQSFIR